MVITALKSKPLAVKVEKQGKQYISSVKLEGGKEAVMVYSPDLAFSASSENENGDRVYKSSGRGHFPNLIEKIVDFFENGKLPFDKEETLEVMKLREAAIKGTHALGEWITV